ncbi:DUF6233 domain-containing protein [Streptomyces sp. SS162]|uniref:DUF6233 domain-containing protein n=1 Tax=Streptomyces sp. SS162 TaxID=3108484 RepID=UPI002F42D140
MFDPLPPDEERLQVIKGFLERQRAEVDIIRTYLDIQIGLVGERLKHADPAGDAPPLEKQRGLSSREGAVLPAEGWAIEWRRTPEGAVPYVVHAADCFFAPRPGPKRARLIDDQNARELLVNGVKACHQCNPDVRLDMDG